MVQRVEVMPLTERRRRYTEDEKSRIVERASMPGSSISAVSREMGISTSLAFSWRRDLQRIQRAEVDDDAIAAALLEIRAQVEPTRRERGTIRASLSASVKDQLTAVMQAGVTKAASPCPKGCQCRGIDPPLPRYEARNVHRLQAAAGNMGDW